MLKKKKEWKGIQSTEIAPCVQRTRSGYYKSAAGNEAGEVGRGQITKNFELISKDNFGF